jgi:lipopolysaccharide export LptBFGC system permease protein LptF
MKIGVLVAGAIIVASAIPLPASAQRITCYRRGNIIECPGYGEFDYTRNNNNDNYNDYNNNSERTRYEIEQRVSQIYRDVLGRNPDSNGLRTYTRSIQSQNWSYEQVRNDLAYSSEASNAINNIYRQVLGRDADAGGMETYKKYLADGNSLNDIRRELASSPEAASRRR